MSSCSDDSVLILSSMTVASARRPPPRCRGTPVLSIGLRAAARRRSCEFLRELLHDAVGQRRRHHAHMRGGLVLRRILRGVVLLGSRVDHRLERDDGEWGHCSLPLPGNGAAASKAPVARPRDARLPNYGWRRRADAAVALTTA